MTSKWEWERVETAQRVPKLRIEGRNGRMVCRKCDAPVEWDCLSALHGPTGLTQASEIRGTDREAWNRARSDHSGVTLHSLILLPAWRTLQLPTPFSPAREDSASSAQLPRSSDIGDTYPLLLLPTLPLHSYRESGMTITKFDTTHTLMTPQTLTHTPAIHLSVWDGEEDNTHTQHT